MIPRQIIQKIRQIEIRTKHLVNDVFSGEYHSVFKGRGMEFAEVRGIRAGRRDPVDRLERHRPPGGVPYVKRFIEERELTVILMADVSASGHFGTANQMKGEITAEICALLAFAAIQNNDRVGLLMFTDQIEKFIPPKKGRTHILRVIREVLYTRPDHTGTDITQALEYLNRLLTRRCIVFIISDFLAADYAKPLRVASKRHDVVAVTITDPRETRSARHRPDRTAGRAESGEEVLIDTADAEWRRQYAEYNEAIREERDRQFRITGVDAIHIRTDEPYIDPLLQFFKLRERKFAR